MINSKFFYKYIIIFLLIPFFAHSAEKVVFLDLEFIISQSIAGKSLNEQIKKIQDSNQENFENIEKNLKIEEKKLISQKNVLNEEEYKKKINEFKKKILNYNNEKKTLFNDLKIKKIKGQNEILKTLDGILKEYSLQNSITLIVQKKYIILGDNNIDITKDINNLLNKKIKKINL